MPQFPRKAILQRLLIRDKDKTEPDSKDKVEKIQLEEKTPSHPASDNPKQEVSSTTNKVEKVEFDDFDGKRKQGFFKPISDIYPPMLAQISVAASQVARLALGERAAEDRLVLDDNGRIVGTLSISIPGFKPLGTPGVKPLILKRVSDVLVCNWKNFNDDNHPFNIGFPEDPAPPSNLNAIQPENFPQPEDSDLCSIIDYDMFFYRLTHILKGPRWNEGYVNEAPEKSAQLRSKDIDDLLAGDDGLQRTHWPSRHFPANLNYWKQCKAYKAFRELGGDPGYQEQVFSAILKELIVYDPQLMRKRFIDCFGDLCVDDRLLDEEKKKALREKFGNQFDAENRFVDSMMHMVEEEYNSFYRVAVFYEGCEKNSRDVKVDSFNQFMSGHPQSLPDILAWAKKENERLSTQSREETLYSEETISQRYHKVWRDSYIRLVPRIPSDLRELIKDLAIDLSLSGSIRELKEIHFNPGDTSITEACQLIDQIFPVIELFSVNCDPKSELLNALRALLELYNALRQIFDKYYRLDVNNSPDKSSFDYNCNNEYLSDKSNVDFRMEIRNSCSKYAAAVFKALGQNPKSGDFLEMGYYIDEFTNNIALQRRFVNCNTLNMSVKNLLEQKLPEHTDQKVIEDCLRDIFKWTDALGQETVNNLIEKALSQYKTWSGSSRVEEVKVYISSCADKGADKLGRIFSNGGCDSNSLNTLLIKEMFQLRIKDHAAGFNPCLSSVQRALENNLFQAATYANEAQKYSLTDARFEHINSKNKNIKNLINNAMYSWAEKIDKSAFSNLLDRALKEYEKKKGWGASFFNAGRTSEIKGYLSSGYSNELVLAMVFCKGGFKSNSFNTILFDEILYAMIFNKSQQSSLISELFLLPKDKNKVLESLEFYAKDKSNQLLHAQQKSLTYPSESTPSVMME